MRKPDGPDHVHNCATEDVQYAIGSKTIGWNK